MAKIGRIADLDFFGVILRNRDFGGTKFGENYRTFSIEVEDPEVQEKLQKDGMELYFARPQNNSEPPRAYMNVVVDNRYGDVQIALLSPDGSAVRLREKDFGAVDKAWITNADLHVRLNGWEKNGKHGVTCYLKTMVAHLMSEEEQQEIKARRASERDAVMNRYKNLFGDEELPFK